MGADDYITKPFSQRLLGERIKAVLRRARLTDDQIYVDDRTIDSHIKRLRKKFRKTDKSFDGIETLYGVGYKYKEA